MKTIATINFKGGVGKTTVTWCLGDILSTYSDFNVLLCDLDAQASLTQSIELGQKEGEFTDWLATGEKMKKTTFAALEMFQREQGRFAFEPDRNFIYEMSEKYHFVPATSDLYWVGMERIDPEKGRVFVRRLLEKIANSPNFPQYDYVIFDCPPSFTPLSYSVLTCCDLVLVPVTPDFFAAKGIDLLAAGLRNKIEAHPFPKTAVFANKVGSRRQSAALPHSADNMYIFMEANMYMRESKAACDDARQSGDFDIRFLDAWLPERASIKRAISERKTPQDFREFFMQLWNEIEVVMQ